MTEPLQIKILHVEDNETNRYIISRTLRNEGFQVIDAPTGAAGLQILSEQQPDLIILDVQLPDVSGFEVCKRIKANPDTAFIPVLHLSASFTDSSDRAQGLNSGADAYLVQPVETVELIATIRALLRIRRAEESALALAREWQTTFDSMRDGVGLLDDEGRFRRCNQAMVKLLGKEGSDIVGAWHQELMATRLGSETNLFTRVRETRCHESLEIRSRKRWFSVSADPMLDERGNFTGAIYIVADVTDRVQAEEIPRFLAQASTVLSSSIDYKTTLKNIAAVAVPDIADWCVVNVAQEDGSLVHLAVNHRDPDKIEQVWKLTQSYSDDFNLLIGVPRVIRTKKPVLLNEISERALNQYVQDAEYLQLLFTLGMRSCISVPLLSGEQVLGAISLISAESGRRCDPIDLALAEELASRAALAIVNASLYQETEKANRMKDEFLATLSHELRSPLNAMLGWISLLKMRKFDQETTARGMETIERNAKAQAQLVEDLLDVSRIIRGQLRLNLSPVELASIIKVALETIRPGAQAKEIALQTELESTVKVMGDPDRLQQIMWNLLSNAIKFTPQGGSVGVRLQQENSQIAIVVSDSGKGIKPEFLPYVFERFRQADSSTARSYAGLGLGLAIVRHLIELHGGTVHADSLGEGQGATFTVKLPIASLGTELNQPEHIDGLPIDRSFSLNGVSIVIVDDEPDARDYLKIMLEQYGAKVTSVASAREAIEAVLQLRPNVLITDIGMPEQDGYTLLKQLRAMPAEQEKPTPAVALTAYARAEDRKRAIASGFQIYLSKPVEPAKLINAVASLAQESKQEFKI